MVKEKAQRVTVICGKPGISDIVVRHQSVPVLEAGALDRRRPGLWQPNVKYHLSHANLYRFAFVPRR
jgi:hypothetical protein